MYIINFDSVDTVNVDLLSVINFDIVDAMNVNLFLVNNRARRKSFHRLFGCCFVWLSLHGCLAARIIL